MGMVVAGMVRAELEPITLPPGAVSADTVTLVVADLRQAIGEDCTDAGKAIDEIAASPNGRLKEYFAALGAERDAMVAAGVEVVLATAMPGDLGGAMPGGDKQQGATKSVSMVRLKAGVDAKKATAALMQARAKIHEFDERLAKEAAKEAGDDSVPVPKKPAAITLAPVKDAEGWYALQGEGFAPPHGKSEKNDAVRDRLEMALRPFSDAPIVMLFNMTDAMREEAGKEKPRGLAMLEMLEGVQGLECGAAALYMGTNPRLALQVHLTDAEKAETMQDALNKIILTPSIMFVFAKPADKDDPLHVQITKFDELMKGVLLKRKGRIISGSCDAEQVKAIVAAMKQINETLEERGK